MKCKVLNLRPTQFAVGMLEVDEKIKEVSLYTKKELKKYVKSNVVPVVRSLEHDLYVVDKHHFLTVCYNLGIKKVRVEIIKDFDQDQDLGYEEFRTWMFSTRNSILRSFSGQISSGQSPFFTSTERKGCLTPWWKR